MPSTKSATNARPDDPQVSERLDVERVGVDDDRSPRCGARTRGSRRSRRRCRRSGARGRRSTRSSTARCGPGSTVLDEAVAHQRAGRHRLLVDELVPAVRDRAGRAERRARPRRRARRRRTQRLRSAAPVAVDRRVARPRASDRGAAGPFAARPPARRTRARRARGGGPGGRRPASSGRTREQRVVVGDLHRDRGRRRGRDQRRRAARAGGRAPRRAARPMTATARPPRE